VRCDNFFGRAVVEVTVTLRRIFNAPPARVICITELSTLAGCFRPESPAWPHGCRWAEQVEESGAPQVSACLKWRGPGNLAPSPTNRMRLSRALAARPRLRSMPPCLGPSYSLLSGSRRVKLSLSSGL